MNVEKFSDELWVGVKGQSNREIARTLRNAFGCSLRGSVTEVELLIGCEGFAACQIRTNSECRDTMAGSEPAGAKVRRRERENSDHRLRFRTVCRVGMERGGTAGTARMLAWKQPFI